MQKYLVTSLLSRTCKQVASLLYLCASSFTGSGHRCAHDDFLSRAVAIKVHLGILDKVVLLCINCAGTDLSLFTVYVLTARTRDLILLKRHSNWNCSANQPFRENHMHNCAQ